MKRLRFSWRYALIIAGAILVTYLVMDFNSRMADLQRLSSRRDEVAVQATQLGNTQVALETQIAYATSEVAVAEWAYEEGSMIRPGDVPVVPMPAAATTPQVAPLTPIERPRVSNWQVWLRLFIDSGASN
jgi:hypothetical protein